MSVAGFLKTLFSVSAVVQPHLSKLMDYKKALALAEAEKERLADENRYFKIWILAAVISAAVFFAAFIITLVLLLAK